jgi:hypothetical protein
MSMIIGLLLMLAAASSLIVIGMRVSLYFYTQDALGYGYTPTRTSRASTSELSTLERSDTLHRAESFSVSSRYAWSGLGLIAVIILVAILATIAIASGLVL